jgi:hypothetical protein
MEIHWIIPHLEFLATLGGAALFLTLVKSSIKKDVKTLSEKMEKQFEKIDKQFEKVDTRFDKIETQINIMNERLSTLGGRYEGFIDSGAGVKVTSKRRRRKVPTHVQ